MQAFEAQRIPTGRDYNLVRRDRNHFLCNYQRSSISIKNERARYGNPNETNGGAKEEK